LLWGFLGVLTFTVFLDAYFFYALVALVLRVRREAGVERFFRERRGVG